ncbi:MAG: acetyltransferase [Clostridiaceae bacterium]|jgi:RimJ/RimL family protein N-acetyltransferase|nr:acetyltransferase [Clostridiaceae bacterium]
MLNIFLRKVEDADISLLAEWLNKDYILKWYGDTADWLFEIRERSNSFAWIHHFIVMEGQTPIGFCQYYDCYDAKDMEDWYIVTQPGDTFTIDYLIGNESYLGRGYGKAIVKLLSDTIQTKEQARQIIVQPEQDNHASNHVLMANGYTYDKQREYYYKPLS